MLRLRSETAGLKASLENKLWIVKGLEARDDFWCAPRSVARNLFIASNSVEVRSTEVCCHAKQNFGS
jgi:hypothetical protein